MGTRVPSYNKYKVSSKEKRTYDGIVFDSMAEKDRYIHLKNREKSGNISELKLQTPFTILQNFTNNRGKKIRGIKYYADFTYKDKDGVMIAEDVKGALTSDYIMKSKYFQFLYPDYLFEEVKI